MILPLVSAWGWMGCLWRSAFFGDAIEKAGNSLHGGSSYIIRGRLARIQHHTSVGGPSVPVDVVFSKYMEVEEIAGNLLVHSRICPACLFALGGICLLN